MKALEEVGLSSSQELAVLEYCCEISSMPYNRRTSRSLKTILDFVENMAAVKLTGLLTNLYFLKVRYFQTKPFKSEVLPDEINEERLN